MEQGKSMRSPPTKKEGVAETICDKLTAAPIFHALGCWSGTGREFRSEVEPTKKKRVGGRCFKIKLLSSLPSSELISNILN